MKGPKINKTFFFINFTLLSFHSYPRFGRSLKKQIFIIKRNKSYLKCNKESDFQSFEVSMNRLQRFSKESFEKIRFNLILPVWHL